MPVAGQDDNMMPVTVDTPEDDFSRGFADYYRQAQEDEALAFAEQLAGSPVHSADPADQSAGAGNPLARAGRAGRNVASDIGVGIISAPRSAARGAVKGVNSILNIGYELDKFFNTPAIRIFNEKGEFDLGIEGTGDAAARGIGPVTRLPEPGKPQVETVTGAMIEALTQFAVGFKGVDKAIKGNALLSGGEQALRGVRGGKVAANAVKGALADLAAFEAQEERLSNLIQEVPALQNPVTEFLQADPDDNAALAKFKQGLEGLAIGGLADGLIGGVRVMSRARKARQALEGAADNPQALFDVPAEEAAGVGVTRQEFNFLGDADAPDLVIRRKLVQAEGEAAAIRPENVGTAQSDKLFDFNYARIDGPDDVKAAMDSLINNPDLFEGIMAARRGVVDHATMLKGAQDIDGFETLLTRRTGEAFNAEQTIAARMMYYDTTEKVMEAAQRAVGPQATEIDHFNFRKMVAVHAAVQAELMGVRAEWGRAGQALRIPLGGSGAENARALSKLLEDMGGVGTSKLLAQRIAALGDNMDTAQINKITRRGSVTRSIDAAAETWTMGLLTNPVTHMVNTFESSFNILWAGAERAGMALSKDSGVTMREVGAYYGGMLQSQKLALKNAAVALRSGEVDFGLEKIDLPRERAASRAVLDPDRRAGPIGNFWLGALDGYSYVLNRYVRGLLAGSDTYNKTVSYNAQLHALATREGVAQGLEGRALAEHVARVVSDPPSGVKANAEDFANYLTYTKRLEKMGQDVQAIVNRAPYFRFLLPFIRTPGNIFKYTFERTPLGLLSENIRADLAGGGPRAAAAKTKMAMGTAVMAITSEMAMNGTVTGGGPSDYKQRAALMRTGWQPYSVKVGDTYYSFRRWGAFGSLLMMAGDLTEVLTNYEAYDIEAQQEIDEMVTAVAMAASNMVLGRTFMSGPAELINMMSDPERRGQQYIDRMVASFVPAGVAGAERALDPTTSQVFNMMDGIKARIPGMSGSVIPRRNIWGEEIAAFYPNEKDLIGGTAERVLSLFNPFYYSKEKDAPVDRWLLRNGFDIDMPQRSQMFDGVRIDLREYPEIYDRLVTLRGNDMELMRYGNQTMQEFFYNLASENDPGGRHAGFFRAIGNDRDEQQAFISQVVRDYTAAAREVLREEFPVIDEIVGRERRNAAQINAVRPSLLQEGLEP